MRYYIGVDCGGTKTVVQIGDERGRECGIGFGGPANVALVDDETLRHSLRTAFSSACDSAGLPDGVSFAAACAGIAGYSAEPRRRSFERIFAEEFPAARLVTEPDYTIAYWGATHGAPGIIVVAGTGAVTFGRNRAGKIHREDGLGYLLGDRGSGFNLGLRVLQHTIEQMRTGRCDTLADTILQHIGSHSQNDVIYWLYGSFSTQRVAELAPLVGALAEAGDTVAQGHVAAMAHRLRFAVRETRFSLNLPADASVYRLGGLWKIGAFFCDEFAAPQGHFRDVPAEQGNSSFLEPFVIATPASDAVTGATWRARDLEP